MAEEPSILHSLSRLILYLPCLKARYFSGVGHAKGTSGGYCL